jgi:asparagine synthase (glutamine-hydrolysing)
MLHYFDRASMAHSLEVRVPFLDHEFVELSARIPGDLKVRRLQTKYILKQAARGLVPDWVIDKRKIGFFRGSTGGWFNTQARRSIEKYLLQSGPRYADMLEPSVVGELVAHQRVRTEAPERHLLLAILMLEIWMSTYVPRALSAVPRGTPVSA